MTNNNADELPYEILLTKIYLSNYLIRCIRISPKYDREEKKDV